MYSMLNEIDKYIKDNNIPFKAISFHKSYLPDYINMAIEREVKKMNSLYYTTLSDEYELRYDLNDSIYIFVQDIYHRQNFVISSNSNKINEKYRVSGRTEKHIIKWGCLFKMLKNEIFLIKTLVDTKYPSLKFKEKARLEYELIDDLIESKYAEIIKKKESILDMTNYEEDMIESTYKIMDYIRYLNNYYQGRAK